MVDNIKKLEDIKKLSLSASMAVIVSVSAQINFKIGPIPYTMQNFGVMLSGFLLGPFYGFISLIIYLALIAIGLPFAAGGGGIGVLIGPTAGYLLAFPISSAIAGFFRRIIWKNGKLRELLLLWLSTLIAVIPIYALGFIVFYNFAINDSKLVNWAENALKELNLFSLHFFSSLPMLIFTSTVLIFIPQDFFVDHLLAVLVYRYVYKMLKERGLLLD